MMQPDGNARPATTTHAGIPVASQEHSLTVGPDGPILLQVGAEAFPIGSDQLAVFSAGDHLVVAAVDETDEPLDVLLLGGLPIGAPIVHHGPFVMNTEAEIRRAVEDYRAGRLGTISADQLAPRDFA